MSGKTKYWRAWIVEDKEKAELLPNTLSGSREQLEQRYLSGNAQQKKDFRRNYRIREIEYRVIDL